MSNTEIVSSTRELFSNGVLVLVLKNTTSAAFRKSRETAWHYSMCNRLRDSCRATRRGVEKSNSVVLSPLEENNLQYS